jgi:hypothetical protein
VKKKIKLKKLGSKEMQHKTKITSKQTQMNIPITLEHKKIICDQK